jgi:hypothetical protein
LTELSEREQSIENAISPFHDSALTDPQDNLTSQLIQTFTANDELPPDPAPKGLKLESVDDPITGKPVAPPPYVVTLHATEAVFRQWDTTQLDAEDKQSIRLVTILPSSPQLLVLSLS